MACLGYAKVFHELGVDWTLSTTASEAGNFGMFIGSYENMRKVSLRIREAALELGVKRIVFGECGHAWRVGLCLPQYAGRTVGFPRSQIPGAPAYLRIYQ